MLTKSIKTLILIFCLIFINLTIQHAVSNVYWAYPVRLDNHNVDTSYRILLIPLDSRPPCTQFVQQLASIANITIIMPPKDLLDNYLTPARKVELQIWLKNNISEADAVILSIDMLSDGGLLASRMSNRRTSDILMPINLIKSLHQQFPKTDFYAFSIIPRLLIADNSNQTAYQTLMKEFSILQDEIYTFENPLDIQRMQSIMQNIPLNIINQYLYKYQINYQVNLNLIGLVEQEVLKGLIIGQDDGHPFGIANIQKQKLKHYVSTNMKLKDKVFITRGTDEVALTQLGHILMKNNKSRPRIYVQYSYPQAANIIMPFMPHSVDSTVQEKISIVHGIQVDDPATADFILFIHIASSQAPITAVLEAAEQIKTYIQTGQRIVIVDLAEDFTDKNTLLPALLNNRVPLLQLTGYAGWNTTSNSIGTAVTQGAIFTYSQKTNSYNQNRLIVYKNVIFSLSRMIDDWYYQKKVQPSINMMLKQNSVNPYLLNQYYEAANRLIANKMEDQTKILLRNIKNQPFQIPGDPTETKYILTDLKLNTRLPWKRTFEIKLNLKPKFAATAHLP